LNESIISGNMGDGILISGSYPRYTGVSDAIITNSTISSNVGNGIFNYASYLEIANSTISGNVGNGMIFETYAHVEGIYGNTSVTDSTISDNLGQGIHSNGETHISRSTISGNSGGGIFHYANVRHRFDDYVFSDLEVIDSTISSNTTDSNGGGIYIRDGHTTISNSTISGNLADELGGGIYIRNGYGNSITISNSTISGNLAGVSGGGIFNQYDYNAPSFQGTPLINNTIITGNSGNSNVVGEFISNGFNIIGDSSRSYGFEDDLIEPDPTKIVDTILADNGGSTLTHALVPGSPAIDAGNNNDVPDGITTDQRGIGFKRIVDGNNDMMAIVDIGAFEVQPPLSTSVPEPSSMFGLVGLVILGTGSLLRRKRQNKS
jgi:parallel beta-helix repeat protein